MVDFAHINAVNYETIPDLQTEEKQANFTVAFFRKNQKTCQNGPKTHKTNVQRSKIAEFFSHKPVT